VEVDPELVEIFHRFKACAEGSFVIESPVLPRINAGYSHYRCERDFEALIKWLRIHGVTGKKPLHALRKEYGSQICAKHGIYAASQALRHADITITSAHYLDKRKRSTVGLGSLLKPSEVVFTSKDELTEHDEANRIDR
jgi:integrase